MPEPIFLSRAELDMARPVSISKNITAEDGGLALHWWGPPMHVTTLDKAVRTWLAGQRFHMGRNHPNPLASGRHWVDIAYNFGFWEQYIFAGRGYGIRSAAQGSNYGNQNFLAAVYLGGEGEKPSGRTLDTLDWIINDARENAGVGMRVAPHSAFNNTTCPGMHVRKHAYLRNRVPISPPPVIPPELLEDDMKILVHVEKRGGTAFELVDHPADPSAYALKPVPNAAAAVALTGDPDWHKNTVVMPKVDADRLRRL